jgi:hypothetical protein
MSAVCGMAGAGARRAAELVAEGQVTTAGLGLDSQLAI